ncbi:MAG: methylenetetrahydrofolate reductase [NAD(P)H] [Proteobacteria bacterium]|jgi:methylenetetrahydrofolate reductase (NADPH)|nr:methylenetetrahydrofolate reductase [NAD(P)H] [Pseudomonadota bacterium]MDA1299885.1 methylenetetrahydrofolate reductase [NAD(P)H] [Pseudomonadota bacterium]
MSCANQFSLEFSAPRTDEETAKLLATHDRLQQMTPAFYSVTYGAGGSTKDGTRGAVLKLRERGSDVAPHLSFGGDSPAKIEQLLNDYRDAGIRRVVALRGDLPSGVGQRSGIVHADELVRFIRDKTGDHFHIEVAAYPEIHPESSSVESDLDYFKQKVDAGANGAITQYFYNADAYFRYRDACQTRGIDIPIVPGIMPMTNFAGLVRFSNNCGAEIPRWIFKHLESYKDDADATRQFGLEVVTSLCERLLTGGAPGLHFYTLNQSLPTLRIWRNLGLG